MYKVKYKVQPLTHWHWLLCCTTLHHFTVPAGVTLHTVQIQDFAGSKAAQSHSHTYFTLQHLSWVYNCLLFSGVHDLPQICYVKEKCRWKIWKCSLILSLDPFWWCTIIILFSSLHSHATSSHTTVLICFICFLCTACVTEVRAAIPSINPSATFSSTQIYSSLIFSVLVYLFSLSLVTFIFKVKAGIGTRRREAICATTAAKIKRAQHVTLEINLERVSVVKSKGGNKQEQPCVACEEKFRLIWFIWCIFTINDINLEGIATLSLFQPNVVLYVW